MPNNEEMPNDDGLPEIEMGKPFRYRGLVLKLTGVDTERDYPGGPVFVSFEASGGVERPSFIDAEGVRRVIEGDADVLGS